MNILGFPLLALFLTGCQKPDDTIEGTYMRLVRRGELKSAVRVDDEDTTLTVDLWIDRYGDLQGDVLLHGDLEMYSFDVWNFDRREWYSAKDIYFDEERLLIKGSVEVPKIPFDVGFKAELPAHYAWMILEVDFLGVLKLYKLDEANEEESRRLIEGE